MLFEAAIKLLFPVRGSALLWQTEMDTHTKKLAGWLKRIIT